MSDKMREEFQAWIITVHDGARLNMGLEMVTSGARYASLEVEWAYRAWIASRAALVVELPEKWGEYTEAGSAACDAIDACRESIHATGVTTK